MCALFFYPLIIGENGWSRMNLSLMNLSPYYVNPNLLFNDYLISFFLNLYLFSKYSSTEDCKFLGELGGSYSFF